MVTMHLFHTERCFMVDAIATNSSHCRNNRPHQDTTCPPTLFISEIIQESNQLRLLEMSYQQIAKSLNTNKKNSRKSLQVRKEVILCSGQTFPRHCEPSKGRRGNLVHPKERYIWTKVRILYETDKAVLVDNGMKIWIPKSRIHRIRLKNNIFEIYVKESTVG